MEPKPTASPQSEPVATSPVAPPVAKVNPVPDVNPSAQVYEVKSGDTLTRIAKTYGTTIKAIEAANGLTDDRIVVGAKLKIPEA